MAKKETKEKFEAIEVSSTEFSNYVSIADESKCYRKAGYESPVKQRRISIGNHRWYTEPKKGIYRRGATYLSDKIQVLLGEAAFMASWRKSFTKELSEGGGNGDEKFDTWLASTADFGTLAHELFNEDVVIKNSSDKTLKFNDDTIFESVNAFGKKYNLNDSTRFQAQATATKAILAFREFVKDYQLDILSIEEMATSAEIMTTTPIDIFALGEWKGQKVVVMANMKTSESSGTFHKWQCAIEYKCAADSLGLDNFVSLGYQPLICTVRPKDWRLKSGATYEVVDYTEFAQSEFAIETISSVSKILIAAGQYKKPSMAYPSLDSSVEGGYVIKDAFI